MSRLGATLRLTHSSSHDNPNTWRSTNRWQDDVSNGEKALLPRTTRMLLPLGIEDLRARVQVPFALTRNPQTTGPKRPLNLQAALDR